MHTTCMSKLRSETFSGVLGTKNRFSEDNSSVTLKVPDIRVREDVVDSVSVIAESSERVVLKDVTVLEATEPSREDETVEVRSRE